MYLVLYFCNQSNACTYAGSLLISRHSPIPIFPQLSLTHQRHFLLPISVFFFSCYFYSGPLACEFLFVCLMTEMLKSEAIKYITTTILPAQFRKYDYFCLQRYVTTGFNVWKCREVNMQEKRYESYLTSIKLAHKLQRVCY